MDERRVSRRKFIRLGAALGLGSVGASIMTACSGGGDYAGNEAPATAAEAFDTAGGNATGTGPKVGVGQAIVKESEVAAKTAFPFTDAATAGAKAFSLGCVLARRKPALNLLLMSEKLAAIAAPAPVVRDQGSQEQGAGGEATH